MHCSIRVRLCVCTSFLWHLIERGVNVCVCLYAWSVMIENIIFHQIVFNLSPLARYVGEDEVIISVSFNKEANKEDESEKVWSTSNHFDFSLCYSSYTHSWCFSASTCNFTSPINITQTLCFIYVEHILPVPFFTHILNEFVCVSVRRYKSFIWRRSHEWHLERMKSIWM